MLLRSFAPVLLVFLFSFCTARPLQAQQAISASTQLDIDKIDAKTFAILFRRENSYLKIARSAPSPDKPEAHLDRVIPMQFKLNDNDLANLENVANDWERDTKVLRTEFLKVIAQFHNSFPNGRLRPGVDPTPPSALADLRSQMDTVTLQYRDKLHTSMQEPDFQQLHSNLQKTFANNLQGEAAVSTSPLAAAEVKK
jgi:hypothetical protein